jgi:hypothetical protein
MRGAKRGHPFVLGHNRQPVFTRASQCKLYSRWARPYHSAIATASSLVERETKAILGHGDELQLVHYVGPSLPMNLYHHFTSPDVSGCSMTT